MRDRELDTLLTNLAPVRDADLADLDLGAGESQLFEEIVAGSRFDSRHPALGPSGRRFFTQRRIAVGAGAVLAALAAVLVIGLGSSGPPNRPEFAAAAVRVAQANPRLLVTLPGWHVTRADEFEVDSGEMEFGDGQHNLGVTWYPARYYDGYYRDRTPVDPHPSYFELLGQRTRTVAYGPHEFATMLPPQGEVFIEIRGVLPADEYRQVVESLQPVSVDEWLAAMPASVVRPTDRAAVVDAMLADVPIPPGFDTSYLEREGSVLDRYELGARVTGAVACEWLKRWAVATEAGDQQTAQRSVDALATSRDWAILRELKTEGGWSQAIWEYADAIATGAHAGSSGVERIVDDPRQFRISFSAGLGCQEKSGP